MPFARISDPETSHQAAQSVSHVSPLKNRILELLRTPMSDPELFNAVRSSSPFSVSESGVRSRRSELAQAGLVLDSGERQTLPSGRQAIIWVSITESKI
jgi:hypothetical protein